MNIILQEYIGGASVKLKVKDAPMASLRGLVDSFVRACDVVKESHEVQPVSGLVGPMHVGPATRDAHTDTTHYTPPAEEPAAEAPKRRGRPRKNPLPEQTAEPEAAGDKDSGNVSSTASQDMTEPSPTTADAAAILSETPTESGPVSDAEPTSTTDAPVTDSDLNHYCSRLVASHYHTPQPVFELSAKYVPEGTVARPTNIRDAAARWAFIRAAEEATGIKYHG